MFTFSGSASASTKHSFARPLGVNLIRDGQTIEAYTVVVGGGVDQDRQLAREIHRGVDFKCLPALLESMLRTYLKQRQNSESFLQFTHRHKTDELKTIFCREQPAS